VREVISGEQNDVRLLLVVTKLLLVSTLTSVSFVIGRKRDNIWILQIF
jgi:hypothetical protein